MQDEKRRQSHGSHGSARIGPATRTGVVLSGRVVSRRNPNRRNNAMCQFIQRHAEKVIGMLNGWDRIRLRGTFRWLANVDGMKSYLYAASVLLKDFKPYVLGTTQQIREATDRTAEAAGRPVVYLAS